MPFLCQVSYHQFWYIHVRNGCQLKVKRKNVVFWVKSTDVYYIYVPILIKCHLLPKTSTNIRTLCACVLWAGHVWKSNCSIFKEALVENVWGKRPSYRLIDSVGQTELRIVIKWSQVRKIEDSDDRHRWRKVGGTRKNQ